MNIHRGCRCCSAKAYYGTIYYDGFSSITVCRVDGDGLRADSHNSVGKKSTDCGLKETTGGDARVSNICALVVSFHATNVSAFDRLICTVPTFLR